MNYTKAEPFYSTTSNTTVTCDQQWTVQEAELFYSTTSNTTVTCDQQWTIKEAEMFYSKTSNTTMTCDQQRTIQEAELFYSTTSNTTVTCEQQRTIQEAELFTAQLLCLLHLCYLNWRTDLACLSPICRSHSKMPCVIQQSLTLPQTITPTIRMRLLVTAHSETCAPQLFADVRREAPTSDTCTCVLINRPDTLSTHSRTPTNLMMQFVYQNFLTVIGGERKVTPVQHQLSTSFSYLKFYKSTRILKILRDQEREIINIVFKRYSKLVPLQAMKKYLGKDVSIVSLILEIGAR
jgi:hypothetical protein